MNSPITIKTRVTMLIASARCVFDLQVTTPWDPDRDREPHADETLFWVESCAESSACRTPAIDPGSYSAGLARAAALAEQIRIAPIEFGEDRCLLVGDERVVVEWF